MLKACGVKRKLGSLLAMHFQLILLWLAASVVMMLAFYLVFVLAILCKANLFLAEDNTFHISAFSDLHYGENESTFGIPADMNSAALMRQVLSQEQPNFVVLNGDLITGENTFAFNSTSYVDEIVAPLVEANLSWASTYGNHDSKFNLSRELLYAKEKTYAGSYTQHGPAGTDGVSNYVLPVFPITGNVSKPTALLWFFDSRGGSAYQSQPANVDNIDNYVSNGTVDWFRSTQTAMQTEYGILPSLAFVHIPFKAHVDLQAEASPEVSGPNYPGLNADVPLAQQGYSNTGSESVPFMEALLDTPGLHSIYSGHDHGDSWCGRWSNSTLAGYGVGGGNSHDRPFLCFCKHSGYGGYGVWNRGVRQIKMSFDGSGAMSVDTWVRMQASTIITYVSLNATYGEDVYSTADGQ